MKLNRDEHGPLIRTRLEEGHSYREISEEIGCSRDAVGVFSRVNFPALAKAHGPKKLDHLSTDALHWKRQYEELRRETAKAADVNLQADELAREIRSAAQAKPVSFEPVKFSPVKGMKSHTQLLLLSDFHIGEVVDPEAVNGMNEYNLAIAKRRLNSVLKAVLSFQQMRPYPISELVVGLLGDMNGGTNHEELAITNEIGMADQTLWVGEALTNFIEQLIPHFPRIRVAGVVGNHPRFPKKPASKRVFDSFDWLSYKWIEARLANNPSLTFDFPRAAMLPMEIVGKTMLLWHGDGVKSAMPGVPWGGVMRRTNELSKQYAEAGLHISYFGVGHYHQANVVQKRIFMNGSLKGLDEHSLKQFGAGEVPTQLLITFNDEKQRLTDVSFITP